MLMHFTCKAPLVETERVDEEGCQFIIQNRHFEEQREVLLIT